MQAVLRKAAGLGFTAVDIPEEYGGLGMDKVSSTLVTDHISVLASFSTAFGAHIGIATLPLVWYGTEEQKRRYLPKLATCEWIGAYGLSEASSGSDAMNIRTRATLSPDGSQYILNGEKQWLTNGGIAGALHSLRQDRWREVLRIPDRAQHAGPDVGAEEHKLGIHGSSTCPLVLAGLQNSERESARRSRKRASHRVQCVERGALQAGSGLYWRSAPRACRMIRYAKERRAFGKAIAEFGLIQRKISSAAARLYAAESMAYRTAGLIDAENGATRRRAEQRCSAQY